MRIGTLLLGGIALIVLLGVASFWLLPNWLSRGDPIRAPAPDFTESSAWLEAPTPLPPAVWEEGWAIDFFVLPPVPATLQRHRVVSTLEEPARAAIDRETAELLTILKSHGAVYMPGLRMPSASARAPDYSASADDLAAAFEHYLEVSNRGRAIVPVFLPGTTRLESVLTARLNSEADDTQARVPAILVVGVRDTVDLGHASRVTRLETEDVGVDLTGVARLPNAPRSLSLPDPAGAELAVSVLVETAYRTLEDVPRRAEPLGAFEVIEMTPIRRPGETDDQD